MKKLFAVGAVVTAVAMAAVVGLWWASPDWLPASGTWMRTTASGEALESKGSSSEASGESSGSSSDNPSGSSRSGYNPSSEYVAQGFDPDRQTLDFSKSKAKSKSAARRDVLTAGDVQTILYDRADQLIPCYQKVLDERPNASGSVGFDFSIDPDGKVMMVRITDSELRSKAAEDCMVRKTREWRFPKTNLDFVTGFQTSMKFRLR